MMTVTYSYLALILCLLTGGGNDLLDYLPTESYWEEKKVAISLETMTAELAERPAQDVAALIADLGSPDAATRDEAAIQIRARGGPWAMKPLAEAAESPDAEVRRRARMLLRQIGGDEIVRNVRRLMAVRTLGELGKPEAVPALKPLLASKELFVADYAHAAIDMIEGRRPEAARAVAAGVADDVWLLPRDCRTVGQLIPRRGAPLGLPEFLATLKTDSAADADARKHESAATVTRMILETVEQVGNFRIDAATFGVSGTLVRLPPPPPQQGVGPQPGPGYLAVVVRGRYHSEWLRMLAKAEKMSAEDAGGGVEVFQPDGETALLMPSDDLFVFVASDDLVTAPVKALAAAVAKGKPDVPAGDDATRKLIESVDRRQVLWAASLVTPEQKALPVAEAFDTIALVGERQGKTLTLKLTGRGADAPKVKAAAEAVEKHAKDAAEFISGIRGTAVYRLSVELLRSLTARVDGTTATVTAKLETTPAAILSLQFLVDDFDFEEAPDAPPHPRLQQR